jgi:cytochrome c-type biogenesis protein CcmE
MALLPARNMMMTPAGRKRLIAICIVVIVLSVAGFLMLLSAPGGPSVLRLFAPSSR